MEKLSAIERVNEILFLKVNLFWYSSVEGGLMRRITKFIHVLYGDDNVHNVC